MQFLSANYNIKEVLFFPSKVIFCSPSLDLPAGYQERWFLLQNLRNKGLIFRAFERRRGLWNFFSIYSGTTPRGEQGSDGCFRRTRSLALSPTICQYLLQYRDLACVINLTDNKIRARFSLHENSCRNRLWEPLFAQWESAWHGWICNFNMLKRLTSLVGNAHISVCLHKYRKAKLLNDENRLYIICVCTFAKGSPQPKLISSSKLMSNRHPIQNCSHGSQKQFSGHSWQKHGSQLITKKHTHWHVRFNF